MGQWPRMAPCPKADSFWEFILSPATPTLNAIGFNFSSVIPACTWTTSHTMCSWGHWWELPLSTWDSQEMRSFTGHVIPCASMALRGNVWCMEETGSSCTMTG